MTTQAQAVGTATTRVDAIAKVTGQARYSAEIPFDDKAYGAIVQATVARGRVTGFDLDRCSACSPCSRTRTPPRLGEAADPETLLLQDDRVQYRGQVVALVVAESLELARAGAQVGAGALRRGAARRRAAHRPSASCTRRTRSIPTSPARRRPATWTPLWPTRWSLSTRRTRRRPSTTTRWNRMRRPRSGTATRSSYTTRTRVRRRSAMRSRSCSASTRSAFSRTTWVVDSVRRAACARPRCWRRWRRAPWTDRSPWCARGRRCSRSRATARQRSSASVSARDRDGRLVALDHVAYSQTSHVLEFAEQTAVISRMLYATPNVHTLHRLVRLDVPTPKWMRAPGETPGSFALESAMDELADAAGDRPGRAADPQRRRPRARGRTAFSSRSLVECLREGARRFGWADRDPAPGVRRDGRWLLGSGVATATYPARSAPSTAAVTAASGRHLPRRDHRRRHRHGRADGVRADRRGRVADDPGAHRAAHRRQRLRARR